MRNLFLNNLFRVAFVSYVLVMIGVYFVAKSIAQNFGLIGGIITIGSMYLAGVIYERRKRRQF
jgi:hypothetical protein